MRYIIYFILRHEKGPRSREPVCIYLFYILGMRAMHEFELFLIASLEEVKYENSDVFLWR